jgi:hypothetical protein
MNITDAGNVTGSIFDEIDLNIYPFVRVCNASRVNELIHDIIHSLFHCLNENVFIS